MFDFLKRRAIPFNDLAKAMIYASTASTFRLFDNLEKLDDLEQKYTEEKYTLVFSEVAAFFMNIILSKAMDKGKLVGRSNYEIIENRLVEAIHRVGSDDSRLIKECLFATDTVNRALTLGYFLADPKRLVVSNDQIASYSKKYNPTASTVPLHERAPLYFLIRTVRLLKIEEQVPPLMQSAAVLAVSNCLMAEARNFQNAW